MARRAPVSVWIVSWLFIMAGTVGFFYHLGDWRAANVQPGGYVWILVLRVLAVVCGVSMLRAKNGARWLGMMWMAYHVALSAFHAWTEFVFHLALLVVIGCVLFRARSNEFFRQKFGTSSSEV